MTGAVRLLGAVVALALAAAGVTALVVGARASSTATAGTAAPLPPVQVAPPPAGTYAPARPGAPRPQAATGAPVLPHRSRALGRPNRGRLEGGVVLPVAGRDFFTWEMPRRRGPNPPWRRVGTDTLVAWLQGVLRNFRARYPAAPRIGIGDLSLPRGGPFGADYGGLGHASHQNGLDVDVLYPRRDRAERAPERPADVDRALSQALVDTFVRAGARFCFVGQHVGLRGPRAIVQAIPHHDDHVHVRITPL